MWRQQRSFLVAISSVSGLHHCLLNIDSASVLPLTHGAPSRGELVSPVDWKTNPYEARKRNEAAVAESIADLNDAG